MAKPAVDGLEKTLSKQGIELLRLSANSRVGATVARQFGARGVPTLIVFDRSGQEVMRQVGRIHSQEVLDLIAQL